MANRNMHVVFCVSLMAILGVVSITPAFPAIQDALDLTDGAVGLLITVFTLPAALLSPVIGMLADRVGRKRVLVPSLVIFGLAGCSCAMAQTLHQLLLLRLLQGFGAAALSSLNLTIIGDMYSGQARSTAMGFNAAVTTIGIVTYPALGGLLATTSWRAPFLLAGLALPVAILVGLRLRAPEPEHASTLGSYLSGALTALRNKQILTLFLANCTTSIIMFGVFMHFLTLRLAATFDASMIQIGLLFTGPALVAGLAASQLGRLTRRVNERRLLLASAMFYALACGVTPFMPGFWYHLIPFFLLGMAQGLGMPCLQSILAGLAPTDHRAGFMTLSGMSGRIGQTVGPLIMIMGTHLFGPLAVYPLGMLLALGMLALVYVSLVRVHPHKP